MRRSYSWFTIFFIALIFIVTVVGIILAVWLYPKVFQTNAFFQQNHEMQPTGAVYVDFDYPVLLKDRSYENNIAVSPDEEIHFSWEQENKRLKIEPKNFWKPATAYEITLPQGKSTVYTKIPSTNFKFSTISYPAVTRVTPHNGEKDVILDIEDPIIVDFDKPTKDFSFKFSIEPETQMAYVVNKERTQIKIIPNEKLGTEENGGKKYDIQIYVKYTRDKDGEYKKIYQTSFETLPPTPKVWEKDFMLRLEQARKLTRPKISEGKYIDINLDTQIMSTFQDGTLLDSFLISSGKKGMWTPTGEFKVQNKNPRAWSRTYGLYMPYWMAFVPGGKYGIHELPEWPGGYKEGANHLGTPVSHGCVRLGVGSAKTVYEWAEVGTPIVIY